MGMNSVYGAQKDKDEMIALIRYAAECGADADKHKALDRRRAIPRR
jgi:hypothetical protein